MGKVLFLLIFIHCFNTAFGKTLIIDIPITSNHQARDEYQLGLLHLALKKSKATYELRFNTQTLSQARIVAALKKSDPNVDLYWVGTSSELEQSLLPIRIPLYRGLLGFRIFIIHKNHQFKFDRIKALDELKSLTGIQGIGWSDIEILEYSGLSQLTARYEQIFGLMDSGRRADYFSRGIHEAFVEVESRKDLYPNLTIENRILLIYPFAMFFFTQPNNHELASVIENGLKLAYEDGSFYEYFYNNKATQAALSQSQLETRIWFRIPNLNMTPESLGIDKKYWHQVNEK